MPTGLAAAGLTGAAWPPVASACAWLRRARCPRQRPGQAALGRGRTFAWLHQFKRLRVRYERRADLHQAFLTLGCCVICAIHAL